jgi:hypothetical protein
MTPHTHADLLRAIADGKQMQELDFPGINHPGNWCVCDADRALNLISRGVEQKPVVLPHLRLHGRFGRASWSRGLRFVGHKLHQHRPAHHILLRR